MRDKRQADRVKAVIALSRGWSAAQVAEILLFDEKTSHHYFERYQKGGLQVLLDDNYSGVEPKLDAHQMSELEGYLEEHILPDAKDVEDNFKYNRSLLSGLCFCGKETIFIVKISPLPISLSFDHKVSL